MLISDLVAVSCPAAASCVAVGNHETAAGGQTSLAETWNGSAWSIQATPVVDGALTVMLSGVSCTTPNSCIAVGWYATAGGTQEPLAESWNGHAWSLESTPVPTGAAGLYPTGTIALKYWPISSRNAAFGLFSGIRTCREPTCLRFLAST